MFAHIAESPRPSDIAAPVFIPAYPLESVDTFLSAPITEQRDRHGSAPLLILSPSQRVDRLNAMRRSLIAAYDHAKAITDTGGMSEIATVLRIVNHELMMRQLIAKGAIHV